MVIHVRRFASYLKGFGDCQKFHNKQFLKQFSPSYRKVSTLLLLLFMQAGQSVFQLRQAVKKSLQSQGLLMSSFPKSPTVFSHAICLIGHHCSYLDIASPSLS